MWKALLSALPPDAFERPSLPITHIVGVGLVAAQNGLVQWTRVANRPAPAFSVPHRPNRLFKEPGPGAISRIFPVHVIESIIEHAISSRIILF